MTRDRVSVYLELACPPDQTPREEGDRGRRHRPITKTVEVIDTGGYGVYTGDEDDADSKTLTGDIEFLPQLGEIQGLHWLFCDPRTPLGRPVLTSQQR